MKSSGTTDPGSADLSRAERRQIEATAANRQKLIVSRIIQTVLAEDEFENIRRAGRQHLNADGRAAQIFEAFMIFRRDDRLVGH